MVHEVSNLLQIMSWMSNHICSTGTYLLAQILMPTMAKLIFVSTRAPAQEPLYYCSFQHYPE